MSTCDVLASGATELYFYDELAASERAQFEAHLLACADCRSALEELGVIRDALAGRPDVAAPASGDWTAFMTRLDSSIRQERARQSRAVPSARASSRHSYVAYLAVAALLGLITFSVAIAFRSKVAPAAVTEADRAPVQEFPDTAAFEALSEEHFERSKLVVLGLATKDSTAGAATDWAYERTLASSLLNDTRMYRQAAEDRGLGKLADVMRDLELVLLQTSLTDARDPASLPQLQRLIRKRDLLEKMDVVTTTGL